MTKFLQDHPKKEKIINQISVLNQEGETHRNIRKFIEQEYGISLSADSTITHYLKKTNKTSSKIRKLQDLLNTINLFYKKKYFATLFTLCFFEPMPLKELAQLLNISRNNLDRKINTFNSKEFQIFIKYEISTEYPFTKSRGGRRGRIEKYLYVNLDDFYYKSKDCLPLDWSAYSREIVKLANSPFFRLNFFLNFDTRREQVEGFDVGLDRYRLEMFITKLFTAKTIMKRTRSYLSAPDSFFEFVAYNLDIDRLSELIIFPFLKKVVSDKELQKTYNNIFSETAQKIIKKNKKKLRAALSELTQYSFTYLTEDQTKIVADAFLDEIFDAVKVENPAKPLTPENTKVRAA